MKKWFSSLIAIAALSLPTLCAAEVAVIVHPASGIESLTEDDIARLFLGKSKSFPGGAQAVPINQNEGSAAREKFNEAVCKKNASQYKAYWSQLVFTGKGTPPKDGGDDAGVMLDLVVVGNFKRDADELAVQDRLERLTVSHVINVVRIHDVAQGHRDDQVAVECSPLNDGVERHAQMTWQGRQVQQTAVSLLGLVMSSHDMMTIQPPDQNTVVLVGGRVVDFDQTLTIEIQTVASTCLDDVVDVIMSNLSSSERFFEGLLVFVVDF